MSALAKENFERIYKITHKNSLGRERGVAREGKVCMGREETDGKVISV